uniref:helix-turn-helix domain-containing protein n=2 Tax=Enterobacter hormaechei TaxID=158836 RepID=UPI001F0127D7
MRRTRNSSLVNGGILSGRIPLISLVQFMAVAEHLNFRHAANALGVSQSSVSARVKAGYRKFNRPFWRVWQVGSGRASAALGTDRAQIGGSCVGFRHR